MILLPTTMIRERIGKEQEPLDIYNFGTRKLFISRKKNYKDGKKRLCKCLETLGYEGIKPE